MTTQLAAYMAIMPSRTSLNEDGGVPLSHYREHADRCHGVAFHCKCGAFWVSPLEAVIEELKRRGLGDENTGVRAVVKFSQRPCPKCGGPARQTTPAWAPDPRRKEPGAG